MTLDDTVLNQIRVTAKIKVKEYNMRRSGVLTGIGNSEPELMDGQTTGNSNYDELINECSKDCYETFFKGTKMDYGGVDAGVRDGKITIGIEPAYFGDDLKVVVIKPVKDWCYIATGHAFGYYGSGIRHTNRYYKDYKYNSKFKQFIDKWHEKLTANQRRNNEEATRPIGRYMVARRKVWNRISLW
jgi:hypothetical protein